MNRFRPICTNKGAVKAIFLQNNSQMYTFVVGKTIVKLKI